MNEKSIEQQHLDQTVQLIQKEQFLLESQQLSAQELMKQQSELTAEQQIRFGSDEAFYESAMDYRAHEQELLLRHQTLASQEKRLHTLSVMSGNPYFARIDFNEYMEEETLYIGIASLRNKDEAPVVIDWRTPVANLFYEGEIGKASYESVDGVHDVELLLKRQFKIRDGEIQSMADTSDTLTDDLLLEILDEVSSDKMKNIVSTIQKSQNAIIRDKHSIIMVQGIAGSGKTSALLQRVAYIIYNNRKWLDPEQVLVFSPNHLFSDYISNVLPSLGESGIPTMTFQQFVHYLLKSYKIVNETQQEETFLTGLENRSNRLKSGLALPQYLKDYVRRITPLGPIFLDLKTGTEVLIPKEKIREWYLETNNQLPMYQRMQLLQTKLLKKLGGLAKDEAKKNWVKEAVDDVIEDVIANDKNFEDNEKNERKLRRTLAKKIVTRKFKSVKRRINRYQFISYGKQYLHFLQTVPEQFLELHGIGQSEWHENTNIVLQRFKNGQLLQEDAVLFFLMMKELFPVEVAQKARFIFIDEMQDFSPAQVWLLKEIYPRASFNFCGDLNQKVFDNETIVSLTGELFPEQDIKYFELTTSYRSTRQITAFADKILTESNNYHTTARDGMLPFVIQADDSEQASHWLTDKCREILSKTSYWRTAIIGKSLNSCREFYARLDDEMKQKIQLIQDEDDFMKRKILLIPAYLAKGLEFDQVFLWDVTAQQFSTPQDQLILYTMATRAMHELTVLTGGEPSKFLKQVPEKLYLAEAASNIRM